MLSEEAMLPLSQGHLTLLDACDRKFKYVFFDALSSPSSYEQKTKTQWGTQFHLLMQQRALNLPIAVMSDADAEMMQRLSALLSALEESAPDVFAPLKAGSGPVMNAEASYQSEQKRTLDFNGYLLTVIYDLVVESPGSARIFDWKTHQQPPRKDWLQADWQTKLYLYVLCETSDLLPEQLSMTYCFVRAEAEGGAKNGAENAVENGAENGARASGTEDTAPLPSFYRFGYSAAQHHQTRKALEALTNRLTQGISLLETGREAIGFPKVDEAKGLCVTCPFAIRCDRTSAATPTHKKSDDPYHLLRAARQITAESVEEVPL